MITETHTALLAEAHLVLIMYNMQRYLKIILFLFFLAGKMVFP